MAYGGFKDLSRRIVSSQVLRDEASNICKKLKLDGYQSVLALTVYNFFKENILTLILQMVILHVNGQIP